MRLGLAYLRSMLTGALMAAVLLDAAASGLVSGLASPVAASAAVRVFTIAGTESEAVATPTLCESLDCFDPHTLPASWTATNRRFGGHCLSHFPSGTILLCLGAHGGARVADLLDNGVLAQWPRPRINTRPLDSCCTPLLATVLPDGAVAAADDEVGVRIVRPDASVTAIWDTESESEPEDFRAIAALPTGRVLVSDAYRQRIWSIGPDGTRVAAAGTGHRGFSGDGGTATRARIHDPGAVTGLPDGSFVFWDGGNHRIRHVAADGTISTVGGGGRGWHERAQATSVDLGNVTSIAGDGRMLLVGGSRGVVRIDDAGRVHTMLPASSTSYPPNTTRSIATDGRAAAAITLHSPVVGVDLLPNGTPLVLTADDSWAGSRLIMLSSIARAPRLAVALPTADRTAPGGHITVLATRPASAIVSLVRAAGAGTILRRHVRLRAGRTTVPVALPSDGAIYELRVSARAADGSVATHRLTLVAGHRLTRGTAGRMKDVVDDLAAGGASGQTTHDCRPVSAVTWRCRWSFGGEGMQSTRGVSWYTLRPDGLIAYRELQQGTARSSFAALFEPQAGAP